MACEEEYARMMGAPAGSDERDQAEADFYECIRFMLSIYEARRSHSADMDVARYEQMKRLMEATKELFGRIKPRPPKDITRSREVRTRSLGIKNPMVFSKALTEGFMHQISR